MNVQSNLKPAAFIRDLTTAERYLGAPRSLGELIAGPARGRSRYQTKRSEPCAACRNNRHSACVSIHCSCLRCNPVA